MKKNTTTTEENNRPCGKLKQKKMKIRKAKKWKRNIEYRMKVILKYGLQSFMHAAQITLGKVTWYTETAYFKGKTCKSVDLKKIVQWIRETIQDFEEHLVCSI